MNVESAPRDAAGRGRMLDRLGFLALGAMFVPYMGWVFIAEREMFSRAPPVLVAVVFVLAMLFYYSGARHWLLHRKTRRARWAQ